MGALHLFCLHTWQAWLLGARSPGRLWGAITGARLALTPHLEPNKVHVRVKVKRSTVRTHLSHSFVHCLFLATFQAQIGGKVSTHWIIWIALSTSCTWCWWWAPGQQNSANVWPRREKNKQTLTEGTQSFLQTVSVLKSSCVWSNTLVIQQRWRQQRWNSGLRGASTQTNPLWVQNQLSVENWRTPEVRQVLRRIQGYTECKHYFARESEPQITNHVLRRLIEQTKCVAQNQRIHSVFSAESQNVTLLCAIP